MPTLSAFPSIFSSPRIIFAEDLAETRKRKKYADALSLCGTLRVARGQTGPLIRKNRVKPAGVDDVLVRRGEEAALLLVQLTTRSGHGADSVEHLVVALGRLHQPSRVQIFVARRHFVVHAF